MDNQLGMFSSEHCNTPLAFKQRPSTLDSFVGQNHIISKIEQLQGDYLPHIVFHGPPGCGKTTLAHILAGVKELELFEFNAVLGGVNDLRKIINTAISQTKKCAIFIDEIHRFNKAQQDALLPYLEKSSFVLLGATTENPNTSLNKAILSRVQTWSLYSLKTQEIREILKNSNENVDDKLLDYISENVNGDARAALNQLEHLISNADKIKDLSFKEITQKFLNSRRRYDKNSERHYDVISAFIKSVRGSDADAAVLWLAVMLDGGEDIEFIARRLIILASEDVGNADPRALQIAVSAHTAIKTIGMPEARIILSQATVYLAKAPKSNASYMAINAALDYVKNNPTIEVPYHLRNHHPQKKNYKYPHSYDNHWVKQDYTFEKDKKAFYKSSELGYEKLQDDFEKRTQH